MRTLITFTLALVLCLALVSASSEINIYVDSLGDALFLGRTNETTLVLPVGVAIEGTRIQGSTSNLTFKEGEMWSFTYRLEGADLTVTLPEGAVITSVSDSEIALDRNQITLSSPDEVRATYTIQKTTDVSSNVVLGIIILGLVAIVVIGYGGNSLKKAFGSFVIKRFEQRRTKKAQPKNNLEKLKPLLHEREHLILTRLRALGKVKMSYLRRETGLPKASFSRHIHELEKKNLVMLSGEGKNQFIELKRSFQ